MKDDIYTIHDDIFIRDMITKYFKIPYNPDDMCTFRQGFYFFPDEVARQYGWHLLENTRYNNKNVDPSLLLLLIICNDIYFSNVMLIVKNDTIYLTLNAAYNKRFIILNLLDTEDDIIIINLEYADRTSLYDIIYKSITENKLSKYNHMHRLIDKTKICEDSKMFKDPILYIIYYLALYRQYHSYYTGSISLHHICYADVDTALNRISTDKCEENSLSEYINSVSKNTLYADNGFINEIYSISDK